MQVTKDPIGHKGARLTSQISLPGRFLVYVPDGTTSGISRKLPDTERNRLKTLLKEIVPDGAGVIVRTAAEGASEEELTRDVERLTARWSDIEGKVEKGNAPQLLYGEPDLTLKVVRDLFTEDFGKLVVSGDDAWDMVDELRRARRPRPGRAAGALRRRRATSSPPTGSTSRSPRRLDRKVWLPSGGSLIIDRTEAMTVVDVNTGKFTGSGGNLEETVTKNNLEAAEEMVRQLRLRDIGGIIVVDFIDMVLESNRDLVLRRLVECLGRDRTRHQVAEVTSLGLVQMTRKRIGTGLLEAFSESCEHCQGRGLLVHHEPVEGRKKAEEEPRRGTSLAAAAATTATAATGTVGGTPLAEGRRRDGRSPGRAAARGAVPPSRSGRPPRSSPPRPRPSTPTPRRRGRPAPVTSRRSRGRGRGASRSSSQTRNDDASADEPAVVVTPEPEVAPEAAPEPAPEVVAEVAPEPAGAETPPVEVEPDARAGPPRSLPPRPRRRWSPARVAARPGDRAGTARCGGRGRRRTRA